ncbi:TRAP transporter substrate-binding protein [Pseudovibrio sp. Tun.PSC04-5.I4]|uniref:TRAP transporter substrate-binding protein n=1 Tax=Pseudovibrio sp. Tun.PSC04-5.I4 TaxID=1798213 RepID=UPI000890C2D8|nr:TRAP transporter substrate-binding protein [Pseudovibrio sp. Tun.PSC04-5.I4]SDR48062.1 TRAP-type C4-dicarboxylate transport system, substrate-binding protein [Pseudovibrio sp. Tun.PSC04-5.I4]
MKSLFKTMLLGATAVVGLTFAAQAENLVLVNADAINSPVDLMNKHFAELVEERSNGEIDVNYITGTQLGTPPQVMDQLSAGSLDAFGTAGSWLSSVAPDTQILTWGFTFRDAEHVFNFFQSDLFDGLTRDMIETNRIRPLSAGPTEPRIVFLTEELDETGDFSGRKMRIPQIPAYLRLWGAIGAQPTQVAWGEVFLAMKTGIVDGAEGPPSAAISQRFHEAAPNVYMTNHVWATSTIMINEDKFQSFSSEHQDLLTKAAEDSSKWVYNYSTERRESVLDEMRKGGAIIREIDATPLREAALSAVESVEAEGLWHEGLYELVQQQ